MRPNMTEKYWKILFYSQFSDNSSTSKIRKTNREMQIKIKLSWIKNFPGNRHFILQKIASSSLKAPHTGQKNPQKKKNVILKTILPKKSMKILRSDVENFPLLGISLELLIVRNLEQFDHNCGAVRLETIFQFFIKRFAERIGSSYADIVDVTKKTNNWKMEKNYLNLWSHSTFVIGSSLIIFSTESCRSVQTESKSMVWGRRQYVIFLKLRILTEKLVKWSGKLEKSIFST